MTPPPGPELIDGASSSSDEALIGALVGGIVGGLALVLLGLAAMRYRQRGVREQDVKVASPVARPAGGAESASTDLVDFKLDHESTANPPPPAAYYAGTGGERLKTEYV